MLLEWSKGIPEFERLVRLLSETAFRREVAWRFRYLTEPLDKLPRLVYMRWVDQCPQFQPGRISLGDPLKLFLVIN